MLLKRLLRLLYCCCTLGLLTSCNAEETPDVRLSSPHFKDGVFQNLHPREKEPGFWDVLKMRWSSSWADWPDWVETKSVAAPASSKNDKHACATVINHATVLIQLKNINILTDPIYSARCSPVSWAGPKRVRAPAIPFDHLPPIHLVLISHDHYDHLDRDTITRLVKRNNPLIVVGLGVKNRIKDLSSRIIELDWWQSYTFSENLTLHFTPTQHFSGRGLFDRNTTLWGAYVIKTPYLQIYFGGDSGYADHYKQTYERYGPMDLALLPIGAYAPPDFMGYVHTNPQEAVQAHKAVHARKSLAIHYGTFRLSAEEIDAPIKALLAACKKAKLPPQAFVSPPFGSPIYIEAQVSSFHQHAK